MLALIVVALCLAAGDVRNASAQASEGKAPTAADRRETKGWLRYDYDGTSFRYPKGWKIEPILWESAAGQVAGDGPSEVGITISPEEDHPGGITYGGRGASCEMFPPPCKCFELYDTLYSCPRHPEEVHVFDLLVSTIRNESHDGNFTIVFPAAQDALHPNQRYAIRWQTKAGTPHHNVDIMIRDTSKLNSREASVLDIKDVPNNGHYEWQTPASIVSPGPYLVDISFVVPEKVKPPAVSGGHIYSGVSSPFYIQ